MSVNRKLTIAFLAPAVMLGTLCSPSVALADPTPPVKKQVLKRGMELGGFDAKVAKANGYKIVTYPNGDRQSVPIDPKSGKPKSPILRAGAVAPQNSDYDRVVGNCGSSWIAVRQTGTNNVQVASGFTVSPAPAIEYSWTISLTDANGTSTQNANGFLFFRDTWARSWNNLFQQSWTFDFVESGVAVLANGEICFSGRPNVTISGLD